ncbi:MAG: hypothetical protein L0Z47_10935 [Actinobacteria bacterium]|nr:hypothetical protein [Actinomycetota bacterium]
MVRGFLAAAAALAVVACSTAGTNERSDVASTTSGSSDDETRGQSVETRISDLNIVLTYPADWYLAEEDLTPAVSNPREVFSLGSFPLRPGGPNCAQVPTHALHDLGPTDVFLTVQERGGDATPSGWESRPDNFGPTPGSTDNEIYDCVDPGERNDVRAIHWMSFTDQDRYFYGRVALGRDADPDDVAAVWGVLDRLVIEPAR